MPALAPLLNRLAVLPLVFGAATSAAAPAPSPRGAEAKSFVVPREAARREVIALPNGGAAPVTIRLARPTTDGGPPPFYTSLSTAGNINGSGYCEQLFGNPFGPGRGSCTIFYRSAGGTTQHTLIEPFNQTGFGQSVTAADINGDGFTDVIVGDPGEDTGFSQEGIIYVYYGTSLGVPSLPSTFRSAGGAFAYFGYSVSYAGDVNGDGYDDVIVGAPSRTDDQPGEGSAFLYLGGPAGLAANPSWTASGDQNYSWFGADVSAAGDVNGDGYDDVVVGQPYYSNGELFEGRTSLYLGSSSGIAPGSPYVYESNVPQAYLGTSVSAAGDANGDGYADYAAGAPGYSNNFTNEGAVYLFQGSAIPFFSPLPLIAEGGSSDDSFGYDLAAGGDFNGDGFGDLIAGRPGYADVTGTVGALDIMLGLSDLGDWPFSGLFPGAYSGGGFGQRVGIGSDLDGDGFSDATSLEVPLLRAPEGVAPPEFVSISGFSLGEIGFGIVGLLATSSFGAQAGAALAADGDVNGDGFDDVIVGAPLFSVSASNEGQVQIFFGHPGGVGTPSPGFGFFPPPDWSYATGVADATFGASVAYAGDVNGDGYDDVIVGAPGYQNGQTGEGAAFVFYGSPSGPGTAPDWVSEGNLAFGQYGYSVASAGDVNGDGYADVLVGAPLQSLGQSLEGAAYLYYGSALGLSQAPVRVFESNVANYELGITVAGLGDIDGDGLDDFGLGVPLYSNGQSSEGAIYVYRGAFAGPGAVWDIVESNQANNFYGVAFARGGDLNCDGRGDLIVGNRYSSVGFSSEGSIDAFYGSPGGFANVPDWSIPGGAQDAQLGYSVSTAGDINGDGCSDIMAGAPTAAGGDGLAFVYLGAPSGPSIFPAQQIYEGAGGRTGTAVAGGGDFDGDGFGDVVTGSPLTVFGKGFQNGTVLYDFPGQLQPNVLAHRPIDAFRPLADTPIGTGLRSDSPSSYRLRGRARSPMGRSRVRAEVESKLVGTAFNGTGLATSAWTKLPNPVSGTPNTTTYSLNVTGLGTNTKHHWRARYATRSLYYSWTPWFSPQANSSTQGDVRTAGGEHVVAVDPIALGAGLALAAARPNPASGAGTTTLAYGLPGAGRVRLALHDATGRRVRVLLDLDRPAGPGSTTWDLKDDAGARVASGVYFMRLSFGGETRESKVVVLP